MRVIGVDAAVAPDKTGLCLATWSSRGGLSVDALAVGARRRLPLDIITEWLAVIGDAPWLLAVDAPLGWPAPLASALADHQAGAPLRAASAHAAFRRKTDETVAARTGKRPLDVGADRIARTAFAALALAEALRDRTGQGLPLAWSPVVPEPSLIEVYPAATLAVRGLKSSGYKGDSGKEAREMLISQLSDEVSLTSDQRELSLATDHAFDAALCALSAADFLAGQAHAPDAADAEAMGDAKREGWIWVRSSVAIE